MRPPAPVTSTVLLALSAMATTPNSLFTPSWFLFFLREKKPKEEEEERERERSFNEEEETGRGSDGGRPQYLWHWLGEVAAQKRGTRVAIPIRVVVTVA